MTKPEVLQRNFIKKKKKNAKSSRHHNKTTLEEIINGQIKNSPLRRIQSILDKKHSQQQQTQQMQLGMNMYLGVSNNSFINHRSASRPTINLGTTSGSRQVRNPYKIKQKRKKTSGSVTAKRRISSRTTTHAQQLSGGRRGAGGMSPGNAP